MQRMPPGFHVPMQQTDLMSRVPARAIARKRVKMLEIINLKKTYPDKVIFDDFTLHVAKGEIVGVLGKNGVGKTTMFDCITTIARIDGGDIRVNGLSIKTNPYETKNRIGICFQDSIFDRFFNVMETLTFTAQYRGMSSRSAHEAAKATLEAVDLSDKATRMNYDLSGGEKKRLQLAQAIIADPDLILLDEPTAGLDIELRECLFAIIEELRDSERTILLITHALNEVVQVCSRAIFIRNGEITHDLAISPNLTEDDLLCLYKKYCQ
jgi:ABC-2 type transport system ATP-binding protein